MAAVDDPKTFGRARLSFASAADIDEFAANLSRFEDGELSPEQWRGFRLLRGTYGQRQLDDAHMIRVKIPQGLLTADQLEAVANVADKYSRGFGHITTRQNIQLHFVQLHDVEPALRLLAETGLTTREACGNSVRNVTACQYAGVAPDEVFDVTPYAEALTRYFLRHPLSGSLPRKFKIAFEGCPEDHAKAAINDIGWRARIENGQRGFRVLVGGGTAILCRSGAALFEFLPAGDMLAAAEAVVRVFHRFGDYQHRQRNRMKFLIKAIGWERFQAEFHAIYAEVQQEGGAPLPFDPEHPPAERAPDWIKPDVPSASRIAARVMAADLRGPGIHPSTQPELGPTADSYARWASSNLHLQKQPGFVTAVATVPLGDMTAAQMRVVADLSRALADGMVRVTPVQDLLFRWVRASDAELLYQRLAAAGLALAGANTIVDVTSCPGAESCKLAVTQSRGLGSTIERHLRAQPALADSAPNVDIKISGCPNGCGQHHIAGIGFQGSLRKVGERPVPLYFVMVGGGVGGDVASFGRVIAKVPARRCTTALDRLLALYADERRHDDSAETYLNRIDTARLKALLSDLEVITPENAAAEDFIDLGENKTFVPETMDGECAV